MNRTKGAEIDKQAYDKGGRINSTIIQMKRGETLTIAQHSRRRRVAGQ